MTYNRVTKEERTLIHRWIQEGHGPREIARRLGRAASSVSRETARNRGRRGYRPKQAQWKAHERSRRAGPRRFTEVVRIDVEERLEAGWTPEIIGGRARLEGREWARRRSTSISMPTQKKAEPCGRTFRVPTASGGGAAPAKRGAGEDGFRTSA